MPQLFIILSVLLWSSWCVANQTMLQLGQSTQIKYFIKNITGLACDTANLNCLAVGSPSNNQEYYAYATHDGGNNWGEPIRFPSFLSNGGYSAMAIACDSSVMHCIATQLKLVNKLPYAVIYRTEDGGHSWTEPVMLNTPFSSKERTSLADNEIIASNIKLACGLSGSTCTLVGGVSTEKAMLSFVYSTRDGGKNWKLAKPLKKPSHSAPKSGFHGIFLNDVSCSSTGEACKAVGLTLARYNIFDDYYNQLPVVYLSTTGGEKWSAPKLLPAKIRSDSGNGLTAVSCNASGQRCTTVGFTINAFTERTQLYSFTTQNGGNSWDKKVLIPSGEVNEAQSSLACDIEGMGCIAVGFYTGYKSGYQLRQPAYYVFSSNNNDWEKVTDALSIPTGIGKETCGDAFTACGLSDIACDASLSSCIMVGGTFTVRSSSAFTHVNIIELSKKVLKVSMGQ